MRQIIKYTLKLKLLITDKFKSTEVSQYCFVYSKELFFNVSTIKSIGKYQIPSPIIFINKSFIKKKKSYCLSIIFYANKSSMASNSYH